jgi:hypothetical protein
LIFEKEKILWKLKVVVAIDLMYSGRFNLIDDCVFWTCL